MVMGARGGVNLLIKGTLTKKSSFRYADWSSKKLWKMTSADVRTDVKQWELKDLMTAL